MTTDSLTGLRARLRAFARERDWEQYHTPKNLAMALAAECGELLALFQWLTPDESRTITSDDARSEAVRDELADVMIYLLRLADILEIDLVESVHDKVERNERRYPSASVRGRADVDPTEASGES